MVFNELRCSAVILHGRIVITVVRVINLWTTHTYLEYQGVGAISLLGTV